MGAGGEKPTGRNDKGIVNLGGERRHLTAKR